MKLVFMGSGSAFTIGDGNFHSNMFFEDENHHRLLIDCGSDARHSLYQLGLSHGDIDGVYISHLHADHVGGLEWLAFNTILDKSRTHKPKLFISQSLVKEVWENVLLGGLRSFNDVQTELATYFDVHSVGDSNTFQWGKINFKLVQTQHIVSSNELVPSYGLFFTVNGINGLITTDTQFIPERYMEYYRKADIIFHDCETTPKPCSVHSHYTQLITLEPEIKAKMWLYHYNPGALPDAKKDGFRGFVKKGQSFELNTLADLK